MGPVTRSRVNKDAQPSSSKVTLDEESSELSEVDTYPGSADDAATPGAQSKSGEESIQSLLSRALGGVRELERENTNLHKKVKALEAKLDRLTGADDVPLALPRGKRSAATAAKLKSEVFRLSKQVQRLEKANEKYRKRIHQLSLKELKTEAEDLLDTAEFEVGDSAYKMRKLLRKFHDLMLANSLDENEECMICMEPLQPGKARSLPCQHTFCNSCVRQLVPEPDDHDSIRCPTCRSVCLREEAEPVEFTASEQWDALLDVAKQWAKMDVRREEDTTEEEDAEEFIDDEQDETSTTVSGPAPANPLESSPEPQPEADQRQDTAPLTPPRLRKRRIVSTSSPEPEPEPEPEPANAGTASEPAEPASANAAGHEEEQGNSMSQTPSTPPPSIQRTPSYAESPRNDKRRRLEELAEARSQRRRR
ncbi:hypothetical protein PYCCODRAFT_1433394 [Trametes coccinea BRFM310]|uniref:RING-type domain-containing protein n=1 Tax=Trametes coccinea (strain BRFM310) TaxID=1353009 RepID=A0A1Y2IV50_TRAC3|nr:hypothetical protein PYCCODRAFT_1433394 [Trametes coccinea BRFM310]